MPNSNIAVWGMVNFAIGEIVYLLWKGFVSSRQSRPISSSLFLSGGGPGAKDSLPPPNWERINKSAFLCVFIKLTIKVCVIGSRPCPWLPVVSEAVQKMETKELLGGMEESSVSPMRGQFSNHIFFYKSGLPHVWLPAPLCFHFTLAVPRLKNQVLGFRKNRKNK